MTFYEPIIAQIPIELHNRMGVTVHFPFSAAAKPLPSESQAKRASDGRWIRRSEP